MNRARYPLLGKVIGGRYRLIGGLGQGGLGTVYLAQHMHLGQLFAVKFLDLETVGLEATASEKAEYGRDFLKEARVASLIRHDAVVKVSDFGDYEKLPFLVMEYVPGPSLLQVLRERGRFAVPEAVSIARRIAEALDAFHKQRLVHRDLKPANVILDPRGGGRLTLVDLGLVKDLSGSAGKNSTHPMALRGTPGYLAPEQVPAWILSGAGVSATGDKRPVDARVDLYALGVILYECLTGVSPYPSGGNTAIIVYACTRDPIPISSINPPVYLPPGLSELIYDTMARDPDRRPPSAAAFIERLDAVTNGHVAEESWPAILSTPNMLKGSETNDLLLPPMDLDESGALKPPRVPLIAPADPYQTQVSEDDFDDDATCVVDEDLDDTIAVDDIKFSVLGSLSANSTEPPAEIVEPKEKSNKLKYILLGFALLAACLLGAVLAILLRAPSEPTATIEAAPVKVEPAQPVSAPVQPAQEQQGQLPNIVDDLDDDDTDEDPDLEFGLDDPDFVEALKGEPVVPEPEQVIRPIKRKAAKPKEDEDEDLVAESYLDAANRAYRERDPEAALLLYRQFMRVADKSHPKFLLVKERISALEARSK